MTTQPKPVFVPMRVLIGCEESAKVRDMDDSDLLRMFASGKAHWDATLDAAMAPRSGGEGEQS